MNASTASTLSGFVRSSHVLHAGIDANAAAGTRLFLDPVAGADVRHFGSGEVEITNRNSQAHLLVNGISTLGSDESHWNVEILPGATAIFPEQTIDRIISMSW